MVFSRKKPTTVGGSTRGSVRMQSSTPFIYLGSFAITTDIFKTTNAQNPAKISTLNVETGRYTAPSKNIPPKNVTAVAISAILIELYRGNQSIKAPLTYLQQILRFQILPYIHLF